MQLDYSIGTIATQILTSVIDYTKTYRCVMFQFRTTGTYPRGKGDIGIESNNGRPFHIFQTFPPFFSFVGNLVEGRFKI